MKLKVIFNMWKFVTYVKKISGLEIEDECYEDALEEFTERNLDISTFARSISAADGDDEKVRSHYIKLRAKRIQDFKEGTPPHRDDYFYAQAFNELEKNKPNQAIFSRSVAHSNGNDKRLKSLYIRNRVKRLKDEEHKRIDKEREEELERFNVFLKKHPSGYELSKELKWSFFKKSNAGEDVADEIKQAADDLHIRRRETRIFILSLVALFLGAFCAKQYISKPYELPPPHKQVEATEDLNISINGKSFSFTCPAGFTMISDRAEMKDFFPLIDQDYRHVTHFIITDEQNSDNPMVGRFTTPSRSIGAPIKPRDEFVDGIIRLKYDEAIAGTLQATFQEAQDILEKGSDVILIDHAKLDLMTPVIVDYDDYGFYSAQVVEGTKNGVAFIQATVSAGTVVDGAFFILYISKDYKGAHSHQELLVTAKEFTAQFVSLNE